MKVIESLPKFTWLNETAFYGWVFRICSGEISNYFKKQNRYSLNNDYFDDDTCALMQDLRSNIKEEVDQNLDSARLHSALKKLKNKEKHILELHYFANMSHRDIAQIKDINEGNVRVIAHRAIKKLEKLLSANEYKLITERTETV